MLDNGSLELAATPSSVSNQNNKGPHKSLLTGLSLRQISFGPPLRYGTNVFKGLRFNPLKYNSQANAGTSAKVLPQIQAIRFPIVTLENTYLTVTEFAVKAHSGDVVFTHLQLTF